MKAILDWLDDRTGYRHHLKEALYENIPGGSRWRYVWGSTLAFAFTVQLITGVFLWTAYSPSAQTAWESVYYIQNEMAGGWFLRGLHHFMAQAMVVLLALHLMQVIIDGAYRAPREVNFWTGLILGLIVLGLSLTGYLLPWDQKGYWATKVATNLAGLVPFVGSDIQRMAVGGPDYGHHTLTRFFALHAGVLPGLLIFFLVLHLYLFRRFGVTPKEDKRSRADTTFWPDQVLKDAVACLAVLATVLVAMYWWGGAHLDAPADGAEAYSAARPEWYFLFLFQFLKYFPGDLEFVGAILIPGLIFLFIAIMPFIGRWNIGHRFNVMAGGILVLGAVVLTGIARWEDWTDPKFHRSQELAQLEAERAKELVEERGIGFAGAIELVRTDWKIQGPKLFAKNCASCHRYNIGNGMERPEPPVIRFGPGHNFSPLAARSIKITGEDGNEETWASVEHYFQAQKFAGTENEKKIREAATPEDAQKQAAKLKSHIRDDWDAVKQDVLYEATLAKFEQHPDLAQELAMEWDAILLYDDKEDPYWGVGEEDRGKNWMGRILMGVRAQLESGPQIAPDLAGFGSRAWLRSFLRPENIKSFHYFGNNEEKAEGEMVSFTVDSIGEYSAQSKKDLEKAIIALSAEAKLDYQQAADKNDAQVIAAGQDLLKGKTGELGCADCHKFQDVGDIGYYPDLTGWGSREWVSSLIHNPENPRFYPENPDEFVEQNAGMPAFGGEGGALTDEEIGMIVEWLRSRPPTPGKLLPYQPKSSGQKKSATAK